jgi:hypothetical protein
MSTRGGEIQGHDDEQRRSGPSSLQLGTVQVTERLNPTTEERLETRQAADHVNSF